MIHVSNAELIKRKIAFRQEALNSARKAYLALLSGGVKSYTIDDRELTKLDLPALERTIDKLESEIAALEGELCGRKRRKAFGIVPRDW